MKKLFSVFLLSVVFLCAFHTVFGQDQGFNEIYSRALQLNQSKSYRIKTTTEIFGDKDTAPKTRIVSIYESVPPDRSYYSATNVTGKITKITEQIRIGEKKFVREDKGKWNIDKSAPKYGLAGKNLADERFIEKTTFNGQTVNVYEDKVNTYSDADGDRRVTTRYWFNEEGYLLKTEAEDTNLKTNEVSRRVSIYEYDAKIRIEAPLKAR